MPTPKIFRPGSPLFNQPLHDSGKHFRIGVRPLIKTLFTLIVEKVTGQIDQNCSDMILGDLQSDRKSGIPHGSKCSRLAPTGRFKGADLLHQSHRHQFFDILQYGRPAVVDFCRKLRLRDSVAGKNAANRSDAVDFLTSRLFAPLPVMGSLTSKSRFNI